MKLVRFRHGKGESYGLLTEEGRVICLPRLAKSLHKRLPEKLEEFIEADIVEKTEKMLKKASKDVVSEVSMPVDKTTLLAPLARPPKLFASD